jgi:hypothetical protein
MASGVASACGGERKPVARDHPLAYHQVVAALTCLGANGAGFLGERRKQARLLVFMSNDQAVAVPVAVGFGRGHTDAERHAEEVAKKSAFEEVAGLGDPVERGGVGDVAWEVFEARVTRLAKVEGIKSAVVARDRREVHRSALAQVRRCVEKGRRTKRVAGGGKISPAIVVCLRGIAAPSSEALPSHTAAVLAQRYSEDAVSYAVVAGSPAAAEAAVLSARQNLAAKDLRVRPGVVWRRTVRGVRVIGLTAVDMGFVRMTHLNPSALRERTLSFRHRIEFFVLKCLRR